MATLNGIPVQVGLEVEIYSKSQEKWFLGSITDSYHHHKNNRLMYHVVYSEGGWSKTVYEKDVHLFMRLPPKKQSDGKDEEQKLQNHSTQIANDLPLKKETVYESLRTLLKEARNIDIHEKVTWRGVLEAVDQELYPKIATAMTMSVEELAEDGILGMTEFKPHVIDAVIRLLKMHKNDVLNKELDFIRDLIERAVRRNETPQITSVDGKHGSFFRYKEFNDIPDLDPDSDLIPKWEGLTANLVVDIYGILKAMKFGASQRENYSKSDFLRDIESAESEILKDEAVSALVEEIDIESAVSFHPQYVIKDDLFETVNPLLAMSLVLNKLESQQIGNGIKIKCVVVPALITSIYDETREFQSNIDSVAEYLRLKLPSDTRIVNDIVSATNDVPKTAEVLKEMVDYVLSRSSRSLGPSSRSPSTIFIVFDRKAHGVSSLTLSVHVFTVSDRAALVLSELEHNYFLAMEMEVNPKSWQSSSLSISTSTATRRAQCWFLYGISKRLRFVPEQLVWIVPSLFGRSSTMKPYDFWSRVYGDEYKHRWSISLRDDILSKFHHILTGNILCSVNYHRDEVAVADIGFDGLRDHLEQTLDVVLMEKVESLFSEQYYDSDAIVDDVMVMEKDRTRLHGTSSDSNICLHLNGPKTSEWHQLKHGVMSYLKIECDFHDKRDVADCPLIENVIQNLIKFKEFGLNIDASNLFEFSLPQLVKGLGHLYRVHEYALLENKRPIRHHVFEHVECHLGTDCPAVAQHGDRKRENERRRADRQKDTKQQNNGNVDEVETLCEALRDTLCAAHCYLLHENDELYRLRLAAAELRFATEVVGEGLEQQKQDEIKKQDDDKKDDEEIEEDPLSINYGESVLEWLPWGESPKFESLREELIYNEDSTLDQDLLDRMIVQCAAAIEETNFTLKEALGLKTYADATAFQSELRKAHWKGLSMEVKTSYFHWAMTMYESHLYHAKIVPAISGKPRGIYHGLNRMFMMHNELPIYLGPFSVSTNKTVAKQFSNEKGLLFTIAPSYVNPFKFSVGIEMVTFSSFKNEAEILFNNQPIPIKKTETFSEAMTRLVNHFLFSVKNRKTRINDVAAFWNKVGLDWNDQWIPFILKHKLLFEKTRFEGRKTIDRLFAELQIMNQRLVDPILDMKHDGKPYLVYLLEDLRAKPLLQHYRLMTANFNVLCYSKHLNRSWAVWRRNNNMNYVFGVKEADDSCFDDAEYQINGNTVHRGGVSNKSIFTIGPVLKATVLSPIFFADRVVPIHDQPFEKEHRMDSRVRHDFGDLLKVDSYSNGCVVVDDTPAPNYQFRIGHEVKCSDDSTGKSGKISRVLADKVCVKMEKNNMCSFRWFERAEFPMELTLNLENQQQIRYAEDYSDESVPLEFAVAEGESDQSLNMNPKKVHQFSNIEEFEISCKEILEQKQEPSFIGVYVRVNHHERGWVSVKSNVKMWGCLKVLQIPATMKLDALPNEDVVENTMDCVENLMRNLKNCYFEVTDDATYLKHFRLDRNRFSEWMPHITSHSLLFSISAYRRKLIIERLIVELKAWSTEWIHRILEQKMKDKPMIKWLVEDRRLSQLHDHYRVYMSHFKVRNFQHLPIQWSEFEKNNKMKGKKGFNEFDDVCFEETNYYFDGKLAPFNTPYFEGNVSKISVKNTKLFGDQLVVLQHLDAKSDTNTVGHDISKCLKIDQYNKNSIFIDEVPPKDYPFRVGQSIRCNDQRKGVIAQLTANEICIKFGEANLYSFRWISRIEAPKEVTLVFENQSALSNFEFKTDIDPSSSTTHNFSSIDTFSIPCREISENQSVWRTVRVSAKPRYNNHEWAQIREIDYSSNTESALSIATGVHEPIERLMAVLLDGDFEIREGEHVLRELDLPNHREKEWLPLLTEHHLLFAVTSYRRKLVIERLIVELNLWNSEWIHRILKQNKGDKPMLRWLVEDREVVRLYDHYRIYMSFKVQSSSLLHRRWLQYEKKTKMSDKTGFDDSDETIFQMTTYEADGESILPTTASVMGNVRQITARNNELFGDEFVVLHEFRESLEQKDLSDDFVDALKVDQYSNGCVFVNDIPSTDIGNTVQLADGAKGKISRVTADEICIKIKGDNADNSKMNSYRWVARTEATLIFRGQSDLSNYQFAVTLGHSDESMQFSDAESRSFADVKDFMIPCPGLSGYQSGTVIIGVYAKPRDGDYQWAPVKSIEYPSSIELAQALRSPSKNEGAPLTIERLIMVLLQSGFEIRDNESTLLSLDSELMSVIEHPHIFDVTAYRRKLVIERLMVELKLWRMEWIHRILEQNRNSKPMIQWLVEDRKVSQLYDHYRVFMSRFKVKYSPLMGRRWLVLEMTTKMRGRRGFGRPGDACFQLTTYQADGETIPFNAPTVGGAVRQITARNFKLFGDRPVVLHEFQNVPGQRQMSADFVDALKVDHYSNGCVFVDDIPSKSQLSDVGQGVRFDDGAEGEISQVRTDEVCIKMRTVNSSRWITKAEASKQLKMTFQGDVELNSYIFVARIEHRDESIKASRVKFHTFSKIKDFMIPCGGISSYYAGFAVICIYARPQDRFGDYHWARIKTLKYSPKSLTIVPSDNNSNEAKVNRLMNALIENDHELGDWEQAQRTLGLEALESDVESDSESDTGPEWMALIVQHPLLCSVTSYRRKLVIERFIVELELLSTELIHRILELKMENKAMLQWLVEDRKVDGLYDHYRVFMSRFTVKHSALLNYRWLKFQKKSKMIGGAGRRWIKDTCFKRTDYMADDDVIPSNRFGTPSTPAVKGDVRQITIENWELFGYQSVVLHDFEEQNRAYCISDDFADALRCDGEYVFLNHIPSASYPFCVGQEVECNDGRIGTVNRITAHELCVKFIRSGMVSFQWFKRENIPLELTLTFRYKDELKDYQFAVSRSRRNIRNLSPNEFSKIAEFQVPCDSLHLSDGDPIYVFAKPKDKDYRWICIKSLKMSCDSYPDNVSTPSLKERDLSRNAFLFLSWLRQRDLKVMDRARILERFGLKKYQSSQWMAEISKVPVMFGITAYRRTLLVERLVIEMDLLSIQMAHRMIGQRKNGKTVLEYLVEDRELRRLYDHYRVYTSGFKVDYHSKLLDKIWLEFERSTKKIGGDEWKDAGDSCFDKTQYLVDGVVCPTDSAVCLAGDGQQYCRNEKLFGDRDVAIQIRGLRNLGTRSESQTSNFIDALNIDDDRSITIRPLASSKFGIDRDVEVNTESGWIKGTVSRETADRICVKYSYRYMMSFRWIQRDEIPTKIRYFIENRYKISEYTFAASIGTGERVPLFYDEFSFGGDTDFAIPLHQLVSSSSTPDTVYIYAKPKGKDFNYELIKRIELGLSTVPISTFAVDGKCHIDRQYAVQSAVGMGSRTSIFATSGIIISKTGTVDLSYSEYNQSNAESKKLHGDRVIPKYDKFLNGEQKEGSILLVSGGDIVNDGALQCTTANGGNIYINTDGVFVNNGIIDCGEKGSVRIKCAVYKNNGQITPKPEVIYKDKKLNRGVIHRLISQQDRETIKLKVVRHRGNDESSHPNGLLQKGSEMQYNSGSQGSTAKDWIVFRTESNEPVFPKNIVFRNYNGSRGLKTVLIEGSTDGRKFVKWIQIENISNSNMQLQTFIVDPVSGCFALDRAFTYFKLNITENHGGNENMFYEFRMN